MSVEVPKLFVATPEHMQELEAIQHQGEWAFAEYMDDITQQVLDNGGNTDETTFLRAFFAEFQSAKKVMLDVYLLPYNHHLRLLIRYKIKGELQLLR